MKHGTKVRFRTSLSGMIGPGQKLNKETGGVFLGFMDDDDNFCRIISDESKKVVIASRHNVTFSDTFYGETDSCGYCAVADKSRKDGVCRRGARLQFVHCGTTNKNDE